MFLKTNNWFYLRMLVYVFVCASVVYRCVSVETNSYVYYFIGYAGVQVEKCER